MASQPDRIPDLDGADVRRASGGVVLVQLMTSEQVAGLLQMPVSTVEEYARRGILPSVKLGRHRRFIRAHVEEAILALHTQ